MPEASSYQLNSNDIFPDRNSIIKLQISLAAIQNLYDPGFPWRLRREIFNTYSEIALYLSSIKNMNNHSSFNIIKELEDKFVIIGNTMMALEEMRLSNSRPFLSYELSVPAKRFWNAVSELQKYLNELSQI